MVVLLMVLLVGACGEDSGQGRGSGVDQAEGQKAKTSGAATTMRRQAYQPGELAGSRWVLSSLNGDGLVEGTEVTLNFRGEELSGNGGCNFYGTDRVRAEDGRFDAGPLETTMMACKGRIGEQESVYLKALQTAGTYHLDGDLLEIRAGSGETTLLFKRETG